MSGLLLNVSFNDKNEVKRKGARWNPELKKWYVPNGKSALQFIPWIEELQNNTKYQLFSEYYYIGENERACWKCGELIRLYAFCLPRRHKCLNVDSLEPEYDAVTLNAGVWQYYDGSLFRCSSDGTYDSWTENPSFSGVANITDVEPRALSQMKHFTSTWRIGYSKKAGYSYYANHCPHCNRLQGDFMIFVDPGGAFSPGSSQQAAKIRLYKIDEAIFLNGGISITTCDFYEYMTHMGSIE